MDGTSGNAIEATSNSSGAEDFTEEETGVGRDNASAMIFCSPLICRTSVENSAMYDRCLVCLGDLLSVDELKA